MAQALNDNKTLLRRRMELAVEQLIGALDAIDAPSEDMEDGDEDVTGEDNEPSLGSFDRMIDQSKSWHQRCGAWWPGIDCELDNSDDEDSDPAEESEVSGIGDRDGLAEQDADTQLRCV